MCAVKEVENDTNPIKNQSVIHFKLRMTPTEIRGFTPVCFEF